MEIPVDDVAGRSWSEAMKHEMPTPARIPSLICLFFAFELYVAMAIFGFGHFDFGFRLRLAAMIMLTLPGFACAFARIFGWRPKRRPATAEIRLNLSV